MKHHTLKRAVSVFLFLILLLCSVGAASSFAPVASAQKTDSTLRVHADGSFRILQIADEIIVLADGRVQEHGAGKDILPKIMDTEVSMPMCRKFQ